MIIAINIQWNPINIQSVLGQGWRVSTCRGQHGVCLDRCKSFRKSPTLNYGPGPYGPGPYGLGPYGPGPYGPGPYGPGLHGPGPYGPGPHGPPRSNFMKVFPPACWSQLIDVSSSYILEGGPGTRPPAEFAWSARLQLLRHRVSHPFDAASGHISNHGPLRRPFLR